MERKHRKLTIPSDYENRFDYSVFSDRLDCLLTERGWTQKKLAEELEVDAQTVFRWKKGNRKTPIAYSTIVKLAQLFKVDEEYLFDGSYTSHRQYNEQLDRHMETMEERFKPFIDFLSANGVVVDLLPPGQFCIGQTPGEYRELDEAAMAALMKKTMLFVQMQLLG